MINTRFNFSAGPAMMPVDVMKQIQSEFLNWHGLGVSIGEISHRSKTFIDLAKKIENDLRALLSIPENYHVLFLSGGSRSQFAAVPMNLMGDYKSAAYVQTGHWGKLASIEASRYLQIKTIANAESNNYTTIPAENTWDDFNDCAYLHYVDNETIHGVEFDFVPRAKNIPLVCDMSSNFLSRPIDISKFGLIYACSQKNMAFTGITIVIVRDDLLSRQKHAALPSVMNYSLQVEKDSMLNTPPTFEWYFAGLVFEWIQKQGGLKAIAEKNAQKSRKLYDYLDHQDFYQNNVDKQYRSRMNVIFKCKTPERDAQFIDYALKQGLMGLKGHSVLGGMRASIYNAMPIEGVDALIECMKSFSAD